MVAAKVVVDDVSAQFFGKSVKKLAATAGAFVRSFKTGFESTLERAVNEKTLRWSPATRRRLKPRARSYEGRGPPSWRLLGCWAFASPLSRQPGGGLSAVQRYGRTQRKVPDTAESPRSYPLLGLVCTGRHGRRHQEGGDAKELCRATRGGSASAKLALAQWWGPGPAYEAHYLPFVGMD